jgi:hypothetical protein
VSDDHDRLLAQGPRVAPEPRTATDDGSLVPAARPEAPAAPAATAATVASTTADEPVPAPRAGGGPSGRASGRRSAAWRRLIPVLFALIVVSRSLGGGHVQAAAFGVVAIVVVTFILVSKARQL